MDSQTPILPPKEKIPPFWAQHRLSILLVSSILIALVLTVVSVALYNNSGAAQLDLSRPGYRAVSDKVERTSDIDRYSATGPVTPKTVQEFLDLYNKQAEKAQGVDAFSGDPLKPEVLIFGSSEAKD